MALRTKLVMAQQDLQRRAADVRDTNQKMQVWSCSSSSLLTSYKDSVEGRLCGHFACWVLLVSSDMHWCSDCLLGPVYGKVLCLQNA